MARITRKSYKRKKVVLGLCLFASVALISTGFAAWVISNNDVEQNADNIKVGTVKNGQVEFGPVTWSEDAFRFDVEKNDNDGRVYYDNSPEEQDNYARLSTTLAGYVINPDYLKEVTVNMSVADSTQSSNIKLAETKNYIVLPSCFESNVLVTLQSPYTITEQDITDGKYSGLVAGDEVVHFEYTISFAWGSAFGGVNPSIYYDDPTSGGKIENGEYVVSPDAIMNTLSELQTLLNNAQYTITLTAVAK